VRLQIKATQNEIYFFYPGMSNHWCKPNLGNKLATTIVPPCQDHTRSIDSTRLAINHQWLLLMESRQAHCSRATPYAEPGAEQLAGDLHRNGPNRLARPPPHEHL